MIEINNVASPSVTSCSILQQTKIVWIRRILLALNSILLVSVVRRIELAARKESSQLEASVLNG